MPDQMRALLQDILELGLRFQSDATPTPVYTTNSSAYLTFSAWEITKTDLNGVLDRVLGVFPFHRHQALSCSQPCLLLVLPYSSNVGKRSVSLEKISFSFLTTLTSMNIYSELTVRDLRIKAHF